MTREIMLHLINDVRIPAHQVRFGSTNQILANDTRAAISNQ